MKKSIFLILLCHLFSPSLSVLGLSIVFSFACTFLVLTCSSQLDFVRGFPVSTVALPVFFLLPWCLHISFQLLIFSACDPKAPVDLSSHWIYPSCSAHRPQDKFLFLPVLRTIFLLVTQAECVSLGRLAGLVFSRRRPR
jgi:hypothetical protein